jgi:hypothetical protein
MMKTTVIGSRRGLEVWCAKKEGYPKNSSDVLCIEKQNYRNGNRMKNKNQANSANIPS